MVIDLDSDLYVPISEIGWGAKSLIKYGANRANEIIMDLLLSWYSRISLGCSKKNVTNGVRVLNVGDSNPSTIDRELSWNFTVFKRNR